MTGDRTIRTALWVSVVLNTLGIVVFLPPALGSSSPFLPVEVPRYFAAQVGFTIALFGGVYAWLVMQPTINRPLVVVGGLGKLGFFLLTLAYALTGEIPMMMAVNATPDLVLASVFLWWAKGSR